MYDLLCKYVLAITQNTCMLRITSSVIWGRMRLNEAKTMFLKKVVHQKGLPFYYEKVFAFISYGTIRPIRNNIYTDLS